MPSFPLNPSQYFFKVSICYTHYLCHLWTCFFFVLIPFYLYFTFPWFFTCFLIVIVCQILCVNNCKDGIPPPPEMVIHLLFQRCSWISGFGEVTLFLLLRSASRDLLMLWRLGDEPWKEISVSCPISSLQDLLHCTPLCSVFVIHSSYVVWPWNDSGELLSSHPEYWWYVQTHSVAEVLWASKSSHQLTLPL